MLREPLRSFWRLLSSLRHVRPAADEPLPDVRPQLPRTPFVAWRSDHRRQSLPLACLWSRIDALLRRSLSTRHLLPLRPQSSLKAPLLFPETRTLRRHCYRRMPDEAQPIVRLVNSPRARQSQSRVQWRARHCPIWYMSSRACHLLFLLDLAIAERDRSIGKFAPSRVVANDNNGSSILLDLIAQNSTDIPPRRCVQRCRRLIR